MNQASTIVPLSLTDDDLRTLNDLGERVSALQATLPVNADNLALSYIDPQVIAEKGFLTDSINIEDAAHAIVPISYVEGYAIAGNLPFWEKLDGELIDYYTVFKYYRDQKDIEGKRSLVATGEKTGTPLRIINILAKTYHWGQRVRAYDYYKGLERQAKRENEIRIMEGSHLSAARKLSKMCLDWIENTENQQLMHPGMALDWYKTAIKLERLSLGLDPERPFSSQDKANINTLINYQVNKEGDKAIVNIDVKGMQDVVDVLARAGQFDKFIAKSLPGDNGDDNGHESVDIIDVTPREEVHG